MLALSPAGSKHRWRGNCASSAPEETGRNPRHQTANSVVREPVAELNVQPEHVRVKLFPDRNDSGHDGHPDLASKEADEVHESGKRGCIRRALQSAGFKPFENNTADQPNVGSTRDQPPGASSTVSKLFPAHANPRASRSSRRRQATVSPSVSVSLEVCVNDYRGHSQTTTNIGTATQASACPVSSGRYC